MTSEPSTVEGQEELNEVFRHLTPLLLKSPMKSMAPKMNPEDTKPSKRAKGQQSKAPKGKGEGKGKKQPKQPPGDDQDLTALVRSMGQLVLRMDMQQRLTLAESSFVVFLDSKPQGLLAQILQHTAAWTQEVQNQTQTCSLKSLLWKVRAWFKESNWWRKPRTNSWNSVWKPMFEPRKAIGPTFNGIPGCPRWWLWRRLP